MTTSESKGRFFLQNESIRIDSHNESNRIDSNHELECSSAEAPTAQCMNCKGGNGWSGLMMTTPPGVRSCQQR